MKRVMNVLKQTTTPLRAVAAKHPISTSFTTGFAAGILYKHSNDEQWGPKAFSYGKMQYANIRLQFVMNQAENIITQERELFLAYEGILEALDQANGKYTKQVERLREMESKLEKNIYTESRLKEHLLHEYHTIFSKIDEYTCLSDDYLEKSQELYIKHQAYAQQVAKMSPNQFLEKKYLKEMNEVAPAIHEQLIRLKDLVKDHEQILEKISQQKMTPGNELLATLKQEHQCFGEMMQTNKNLRMKDDNYTQAYFKLMHLGTRRPEILKSLRETENELQVLSEKADQARSTYLRIIAKRERYLSQLSESMDRLLVAEYEYHQLKSNHKIKLK